MVPATTRVKVRFIGTAKGMTDEHIQAQDLCKVTEETLRLKKVRVRAGEFRERGWSFLRREEKAPPIFLCLRLRFSVAGYASACASA